MRAQQALQDRGWVVDYLTVRQRHDLLPPQAAQQVLGRCVVLAAARMGNTRLLDNLEV
jgi:pantoate--beta-alanine ligase